MKKKLNLVKSLDAIGVLQEIGEQSKEIKLQYKIIKLLSLLEEEQKNYRQMLDKIYKECLETDEKGLYIEIENNPGTYKIKEDKQEVINQRLFAISELQIEVDEEQLLILDELPTNEEQISFHDLQKIICLMN